MSEAFNALGIDRDLLLLILTVLVIALFVVVLILLASNRKLARSYNLFMRGKNGKSLEDTILETKSKIYSLQDAQMEHRDRIKLLQGTINGAYTKSAVVKYNAFEGMGGHSSFALAFLDNNNSGVVLNAMHSRTSCYLYVKEIKAGDDTALSDEEKKVIEIAKNK